MIMMTIMILMIMMMIMIKVSYDDNSNWINSSHGDIDAESANNENF